MKRRDSSGRRGLWIAMAVYAATVGFWFWPLFVHFGSAVLGEPGDGTSAIRVYEATTHAGKDVLSSPRDFGIAAPQGEAADAALAAATPLQAEFVTLAGRALGWVRAWNLFVVLAFAACALATYGLLRFLGVSLVPALLGGYVFAFNPWQFEKAIEGHAMLAQTWVFPLLLWCLVRFRRRRDLPSAAAIGAVVALGFYATAYFLLFTVVISVIFALVAAFHDDDAPPLRLWAVAGGVAGALIAPFALYATVATDISNVGRPIQDLQRFGAAPLEYFIPSPRHPIFGDLVDGLFAASDPRHFAEPTLYFGLTTLGLAVLGAFVTRRRSSDDERRFLALFASILVVVAFLMSLPRKVSILSLTLPAPAWAIGHVTTLWRVYARFAVVVGFGLVILAALGAEYVRQRSQRTWPLLAIGAIAMFELAVTIPLPTWRTTPPAYVAWLAKAPPGIVAEYPMFEYGPAGLTTIQAGTYFWQAAHRHPLFNVYGDAYRTPIGVRAVRAASVDIESSRTIALLAAEGVRYVVVHDDVYAKDGLTVPQLPGGLRPIWRSAGVRVARVVATPGAVRPMLETQSAAIAKTLGAVRALASFVGPGTVPAGPGILQLTGAATLRINDPNPPSYWVFDLQLQMRPAGKPGRFVLLDRGRIVATTRYTAGDSTVTLGPFPLRFGMQSLELRVDPPPTAADPLTVSFAPVVVPRLPPVAIAEAARLTPTG